MHVLVHISHVLLQIIRLCVVIIRVHIEAVDTVWRGLDRIRCRRHRRRVDVRIVRIAGTFQ